MTEENSKNPADDIIDGAVDKGARQTSLVRATQKLEPFNKSLALFLDDLAGKTAPSVDDPSKLTPMEFAKLPIRYGLWLFLAFFVGFGLWSAFAPLDTAAVARGMIVVESSRKTISHLEGGIIEEILVKEGEEVEANQPLVQIQNIAAKSKYDLYLGQYRAAQALEARLTAERDALAEIQFPLDLLKDEQIPEIAQILETQRNQFKTRGYAVEGQVKVLNQRVKQLNDQISGLRAQISANVQQIKLVKEEISTVEKLLASGNANRPRLLALQRNKAAIEGQTGQFESDIAKAKQAITEADLQIINARNDFQNELAKDLRETQIHISDLKEQLSASRDVFDRTIVRATQAGVVTGLKYHTRGGVVAPGAPIMDLVPKDDKMIVEAQVQPSDIDMVHPGLVSRLRLVPYKSRRVPPLNGEVQTISPDVFQDQKTGMTYYTARIVVDKDFLSNLKDVKLYPGMPVEVHIITGTRTLLSYLVSPLTDATFNAFKEK